MEQYLTSEQVAKLLQVHPFTVLKYLKDGRIKGVKMGRVYRIKESDVEEFLCSASTKEKPPEDPKPEATKPEAPKKAQKSKKEFHELETEEEPTANEYYKII